MLAQLHAAAPEAQIIVANYYNPFLAAYLTGAAGQALAQQSVALQAALNAIIAGSAASVGADVADVATAFRSTVITPVNVPALGGLVPTNVATICAWTWMCQLRRHPRQRHRVRRDGGGRRGPTLSGATSGAEPARGRPHRARP